MPKLNCIHLNETDNLHGRYFCSVAKQYVDDGICAYCWKKDDPSIHHLKYSSLYGKEQLHRSNFDFLKNFNRQLNMDIGELLIEHLRKNEGKPILVKLSSFENKKPEINAVEVSLSILVEGELG